MISLDGRLFPVSTLRNNADFADATTVQQCSSFPDDTSPLLPLHHSHGHRVEPLYRIRIPDVASEGKHETRQESTDVV